MNTYANRMRAKLTDSLAPTRLEIEDDSARHRGHAGAHPDGGGETHFNVTIESAAFAGKNKVQQHQLVYKALGDRMREEIHALSMKTLTPEQWMEKN